MVGVLLIYLMDKSFAESLFALQSIPQNPPACPVPTFADNDAARYIGDEMLLCPRIA